MASYIKAGSDPKERASMGSVFTSVTVANHRDVIRTEENLLRTDQVRRIEVARVLVDTGATTLSLPMNLVAQLGLPLKHSVTVETAAGLMEAGIYQDAELTIEGRTSTVECLALPDGAQPLLGVIPMEMMGLEPDLVLERLRVLPDSTRGSYWRA